MAIITAWCCFFFFGFHPRQLYKTQPNDLAVKVVQEKIAFLFYILEIQGEVY